MNFLVNTLKAQNDFQPIYYFLRCSGLWPFSIAYNSDGSIQAARVYLFDSLWFFVSICLYLVAAFYYFDRMMTDGSSVFVSNQMYFIIQMIFLSLTVVGIILDMYNRKKLINILDKFITFDSEVCFLCTWRNIFRAHRVRSKALTKTITT